MKSDKYYDRVFILFSTFLLLLFLSFDYLVISLVHANYVKCSDRFAFFLILFEFFFFFLTVWSNSATYNRIVNSEEIEDRCFFFRAFQREIYDGRTFASATSRYVGFFLFLFLLINVLIGAKTSIIARVINFMAEKRQRRKWMRRRKQNENTNASH